MKKIALIVSVLSLASVIACSSTDDAPGAGASASSSSSGSPAATTSGGAATSDGGPRAGFGANGLATTGAGTIEDSFGFAFDVEDADFELENEKRADGTFKSEVKVHLRSTAGLCVDRGQNRQHAKNAKVLEIEIEKKGCSSSTACAIAPGTFQLGKQNDPQSGGTADVDLEASHYDDQCNYDDLHKATPASLDYASAPVDKGEIVITALTATHISGTYELRKGGDFIKGTFDSDLCNAQSSSTDAPVCQ